MFFQNKDNPDYKAWKPILAIVLVCLLGYAWGKARADDYEFISPDHPMEFRFFEATKKTWTGRVDFLINTEGSPFTQTEIRASLDRAIDMVKTYIYIDLEYAGATQLTKAEAYSPARQNTVVVSFKKMGFLGFGSIYWDWSVVGRINHGDIELSTTLGANCLDGVLLHELLHTLFVEHSDTEHSVMADPPNSCEYMSILRLDDIEALQELYTPKPNRQGIISRYDATEVCGYQPEVVVEGSSYQIEACIPASGFESVVVN